MKPILILTCAFLMGCANMTPQQQAIATTASNLARIAAEAAATYYGGPIAGEYAAAGLDALGSVIQGYVGTTIPPGVIKASPGVQGVGTALVPLIAPNHKVTQADVDKVTQAAAIAAALKPAFAPTTSP